MTTNAFGQPVDDTDDFGPVTPDLTKNDTAPTAGNAPTPATLSVDDWLDGASAFTDTMTIYVDGALYGRWLRLMREYQDLDRQIQAQASDDVVIEQPLGAPGLASQRQQKADELARVKEKLEASERVIEMRSLTADEDDRIGRMADGNGKMYARVAASAVNPDYTPVEWEKIRKKIGESQWKGILRFWAVVNSTEAIDVDFSLPHSDTPGTIQS